MRRILTLLAVLAMVMAVPIAANAQYESFEVDIHSEGSLVGQDANGCDLSEGVFAVEAGGVIVETGVASFTSCANADASLVRYTITYTDDSTGNVVVTVGRAILIAFDPDAGVFTYSTKERIVSSTEGLVGNAVGTVDVTLTASGFDLAGTNHWRLFEGS